jgi:hypothetical protein
LSIELESSKKLEIMSGRSTRWTQTLPWSSVYFISYSFPGLVDPALAMATKKRVVFVEYRYPNAMSSIPFGAVPVKTMWTPPGAS